MATETREVHKVSNKEVIETLHDVIESLIDGHDGFQKIGEHLKDETLKSIPRRIPKTFTVPWGPRNATPFNRGS